MSNIILFMIWDRIGTVNVNHQENTIDFKSRETVRFPSPVSKNLENSPKRAVFLLYFDHLDSLARGVLTTFGGRKIF